MLRKRIRSPQKDQHLGNQMADFGSSDSFCQSDSSAQKQKSSSFFSIIGLSVGFGNKGLSDSGSVRSPSSLDLKFFSNLSNSLSFRSQKSPSANGSSKRWDCSKLGLSMVNLLVDETESFVDSFESTKSNKYIVIGPHCKVYVPGSSSSLHDPDNSKSNAGLLPQNFGIPLTNSPDHQSGSSSVSFEMAELPFKSEPSQQVPSHMSSSCVHSSSMSLVTQNSSSSCRDCSPDNRANMVKSPNAIGSRESFGSATGFVGSLSQKEMELSEDYTCIISHGPNPKTTHVFGDCILSCGPDGFSKEGHDIELPRGTNVSCVAAPYPSDDFLSFCYSCNKKLDQGKDIYIYRGDKAFCSVECRSREIFLDEETEKVETFKSSARSVCQDKIFS